MGYKIALLFLGIFGYSACEQSSPLKETFVCRAKALELDKNYEDLIGELPEEFLQRIVEAPDENGALGRNKAGYFHVRFQLKMSCLSDYAIRFEQKSALEAFIKSLEYAFSFQKEAGDFELSIPDELKQEPPPSEADLASGTAFFAYSLGISLNSLRKSDWFQSEAGLAAFRLKLDEKKLKFQALLSYLKSVQGLLEATDKLAPNRLLFDAIAFYCFGIYVEDEIAKNIGLSFARKAFAQRDSASGYFIEGGGWDSSYNGVALQLGFEFLSLLIEENELDLALEYAPILSCAMDWQLSRILASGEISTEGNTRVYPGGEEFLGQEKGVDVLKSLKALFYMSTFSNSDTYEDIAWKVLEYYD